MDRIFIRRLQASGILGVDPDERERPREIFVSLELWVDTRPAAATDDLALAVDYRAVSLRVRDHVERSTCLLVERLAEEVARLLVVDLGIPRVRVNIEKPDALPFVAAVGVEIERERKDYA
jgi:dihydroneopterin aldolase